jgi:cysteine dioxygenase
MSHRPIDALCTALQAEFDSDPSGGGIPSLLSAYQAKHNDWDDWTTWCDGRYTRNLVSWGDSFELMLLCWSPGAQSPIHDHAGQNCWMAVLEGELEEIHYCEPNNEASAEQVALEKGRAKSFVEGEVAAIDDSIAYHLTQPAGGARAVSMHLYARPIEACRVFCPDTGLPEEKVLGYHSVRGELAGSTSPEDIRRSCGLLESSQSFQLRDT